MTVTVSNHTINENRRKAALAEENRLIADEVRIANELQRDVGCTRDEALRVTYRFIQRTTKPCQ